MLHCDVKPSNILFARDGSIRLADFGIAKTAHRRTRTLDELGGSLAFAAPELLEGSAPTPANDVYGLGLSLWFAATGQLPFGPSDQPVATLTARIQTGGLSFATVGRAAALGPDTVALLSRCVARDPRQRPDAGELARSLRATPQSSIPPQPRSRLRAHRPGRRRSIVNGALVQLTVAVFASLLATTRARSGAVAAPDLCAAYTRSVTQRESLITEISTDLERSSSSIEVVERLLVTYPRRLARILAPLLVAAGGQTRIAPTTTDQVEQLALAEALRALGGGKEFLFDGQRGEFAPNLLPAELRAPADAVSTAHSISAEQCGDPTVDLVGAKARMNSAIRSNLNDPEFLSSFFNDPHSFTALSMQSILVMANTARAFTELLLTGHWDWFFALLEKNPDARAALAFEHPDLFLTAVRGQPALASTASRPDWSAELQIGLDRLAPAERVGIATVFQAEMNQIGLVG